MRFIVVFLGVLLPEIAFSTELLEVYDCKSGQEYIASYRYFSESRRELGRIK